MSELETALVLVLDKLRIQAAQCLLPTEFDYYSRLLDTIEFLEENIKDE